MKKIEELKKTRKELTKKKEVKIMKIIQAKNALTEGLDKIKENDLFSVKEEEGKSQIKLSRSKIHEISNLSKSINYLRTPHARTLIHSLAWNTSILHQNSERRVAKPQVINPAKDIELIAEGTNIVLHCDEPDSYIVYTLDESIPCFTNGQRYDPQRFPIIVPKDVLSFKIKFVACKLKMLDSEICVRNFKVSKHVQENQNFMQQAYQPSTAIRADHHEPVEQLNLGLDTPSSHNMSPMHPTGRLSNYLNQYMPVSKPGDIDNLSEGSDII